MMTKLVQLKLVKIKYGGDSIGDDLRIETECLNQVFGMDKTIQNGAEVTLNAEIGQFTIDQASTLLPVNIKIIEQDLVFNDVGGKQIKIKVDARDTSPETNTYDISVKELRGLFPSRSTAVFSVTIETLFTEAVRHIPDTDDGWFTAIKNDGKEKISLPAYLKVHFDRTESKREYFTILEGPWREAKASVKLSEEGKSYLLQDNPQTGPVSIAYSIGKKTLRIQDTAYLTTDDPNTPWKKGRYDIEMPDAPHRGGIYYPETKYGKTWFRVGHSGSRYIHTGRHSLGCITLTEQKRWDDLCQILMKARKGDGRALAY